MGLKRLTYGEVCYYNQLSKEDKRDFREYFGKILEPNEGWNHLYGGVYNPPAKGISRPKPVKSWEDNKKYAHYKKELKYLITQDSDGKPLKVKLYSHRQENYWQIKEIPSSAPDPRLIDIHKKHNPDNEGEEPDTVETKDYQSFSDAPHYKEPKKTQRNLKLILKYDKRFRKYRIKDKHRAMAISKALGKIHWLFCNKPWFIENAQSRHRQYSKYGRYCYPKNLTIESFLKTAQAKAQDFIYKPKTPYRSTKEIKTNIFQVIERLNQGQAEAVIEVIGFRRPCTNLAMDRGTTHQNISMLAIRGIRNLRKLRKSIWYEGKTVAENPYSVRK